LENISSTTVKTPTAFMDAQPPTSNSLNKDVPAKPTAWLIEPSALRSPPAWLANATIVLLILFGLLLLSLGLLAIARLAYDLLGDDQQRASEAVKSLLPIAAAAVGLPLIIWRLVILNQQTRISEAKTQIDRETYYTSIFAKSVELLGFVRESKSVGADGNAITRSVPNIESRLGALYSLERLLTESIRDQRAIVETLCAYVRENSPLEIPQDTTKAKEFFSGKNSPAPTHRADVQAALTIIGRRPESLRARATIERVPLDFRNTNLVGYDLSELNYDYARFANSFIDGANMSGASFTGCIFDNTFIRSARMKGASFRSAVFDGCNLSGAEIEETDFALATLVATDLRSAKVISFNIEGANLENAFGSFLKYSIDSVKKEGPNSINSMEVLSIYQLFQKATFSDATNVSEAVREAILLMGKTAGQRSQNGA
jgi:uncharacterized protein YjbI with pentapeptide repeats